MAEKSPSAVVVGAGVTGLTTAICLAEAGCAVQVWAAEAPQDTTSAVAGALWGPSFQEPLAKTLQWTEQSLRDFRSLAEDDRTGVRLAPTLTVGELPPSDELPPQARLIPDLRPCPASQLPRGFGRGYTATMPLVDMPRYLDYLTDRLADLGGSLQIRPVVSLAEPVAAAEVVLNCSGLGARQLVGDTEVQPSFGQWVVLTNPGLDRVFLELASAAETTSIFPHSDRVLCGGVSIPGRQDRTPDPQVTERILQRCRAVEPRLGEAEVSAVRTGLRPERPAIRLEAETIGSTRVVHSYGHGGSGVSLSWGCARAAAALVFR
ncbi:FAD-dependent oxidoreductase [Rhodococcus sp. X156]|uniref:FAD-dependent oxidoreductase n=1 Tax=Rhodococcus sp. X156 TaxID=2499145 RepID=UPI000FD7D4E0|nr:FAD-dependent oxidoreductase [Rhodococcus sp. X156]